MPSTAAKRAELAAEHALAQVAVALAVAVEALLAAVINARDAQGQGVERQGVQQQLAASVVAGAEAAFVLALAHLVVVVEHGHHLVAKPDVRFLLHQHRVAEQIEVLGRVAIALDQVLQLVGDVVDAQGGVQAGQLQGGEGPLRARR